MGETKMTEKRDWVRIGAAAIMITSVSAIILIIVLGSLGYLDDNRATVWEVTSDLNARQLENKLNNCGDDTWYFKEVVVRPNGSYTCIRYKLVSQDKVRVFK